MQVVQSAFGDEVVADRLVRFTLQVLFVSRGAVMTDREMYRCVVRKESLFVVMFEAKGVDDAEVKAVAMGEAGELVIDAGTNYVCVDVSGPFEKIGVNT